MRRGTRSGGGSDRPEDGSGPVLFLASWYPSDSDPVSGVFVRAHARAASMYHEVAVVAAIHGRPRSDSSRLFRPRWQDDGSIRTWLLPTLRPSGPMRKLYFPVLTLRLIVAGYIASRRMHPALIHANTYETTVAGRVLGRMLRVPVVVSEHYGGFGSRRMPGTRLRFARIGYRNADMVMPVTRDLAEALVEYGIDAPSVVIPNAVDSEVFHPPMSRDGNAESGSIELVFVGRISTAKGVDVLLRAIAGGTSDVHVSLVGGGAEGDGMRALASELDLDDATSFLGTRTHEEIAALLRRADALVLPSQGENLPCVILESLCCGTPVIATRVGGVPEVVSDHNGVLVDPGDADGLRDAIHRVGTRAFDHGAIASAAAEKFSLESVGRSISDVYRACIKGPA